MKKIFLVTFILLIGTWIWGVKSMNLAQTDYFPPLKDLESAELTQEKIATTTVVMTSLVKKTATTTPKKKSVVFVATTTIAVAIPQIPEVIPDFEVINTNARKAIVNIFCTAKNNDLSPISGTGVIVSPDGIVLTNAHVGQYFLLKDLYIKNYIECNLRTGSPAYPKYKVELVYIPPAWVQANKDLLKSQNPQGTGENDFAFLRITGMVDNSNQPANFPYLPPNTREVMTINEPVILVSYPAGFLGGLFIIRDLNLTSGITVIKDYFTFSENLIDIISVPGTVVSQKGSSGGAVVDKNQSLIGIITTSSDASTTGARNLNALTLSYINRSLQIQTGKSLYDFLHQNIEEFGRNFRESEAPALTKLITDELTKNQ